MRSISENSPRIFGLFDKRIEGDDCLMELARLRFRQAGLGAEMHAGTIEELNWVLGFRPSPVTPVMVHLPREFTIMDQLHRERISDFAEHFAGQVSGLNVHDHTELATHPAGYLRAARDLASRLEKVAGCPMLFVEYAAGVDPTEFADFFVSLRDVPGICACIDIGHVGIQAARVAYAHLHPGEDICALKSNPRRVAQVISKIQAAMQAGLPTVLQLINRIGALGKPLHFHLHDGHPLSTFSPFGVSDHLSFLIEIPIGFEYQGKRSLPLMFGPKGLEQIAKMAFAVAGPQTASFTLEIHPTAKQLPLGDTAPLFSHWKDKTNAERMNHWLDVLRKNQELLAGALIAQIPGAIEKRSK